MAGKKKAAKEAEVATKASATSGRGRAVVLKDGTLRVDYIRKRYYDEGAERSAIRKELCEMTGQDIPYQIVFAGTKVGREDYKAAQKEAKSAK